MHRWASNATSPAAPDGAPVALARAIADGSLRLAYQPILELATRRPVAVEALIRLDDRHRDLQVHVNVSPHQLRDDRFVEVVERTLEVTGLAPRSA